MIGKNVSNIGYAVPINLFKNINKENQLLLKDHY